MRARPNNILAAIIGCSELIIARLKPPSASTPAKLEDASEARRSPAAAGVQPQSALEPRVVDLLRRSRAASTC
jgi:hypothetical protein